MAHYEHGSAPDVNNLLGKLRTAMAANGWTLNYANVEGGSGGTRVHISKGGMTVNLRTGFNNEVPVQNAAERSALQGTWRWNYTFGSPSQPYRPDWLAFNVGTGVNLSTSWHNQPGAPGSGESKGLAAMITAHGSISRYWLFIFDDPDCVVLICETRANKFEHIAFGRMLLTQAIESGGEWFSGSRRFNDHYSAPQELGAGLLSPSFNGAETAAMFRVVDSRWGAASQIDGWGQGLMTPGVPNSWPSQPGWDTIGVPVPDSSVNVPSQSGFNNLINASYLSKEGRSILHPIACWKWREGAAGLTQIGYLPFIGRTSMEAYVAGDQIAGVGEAYRAFPSHCRISPYNIFSLGTSPNNPADEVWNYYGTGIAVKEPV